MPRLDPSTHHRDIMHFVHDDAARKRLERELADAGVSVPMAARVGSPQEYVHAVLVQLSRSRSDQIPQRCEYLTHLFKICEFETDLRRSLEVNPAPLLACAFRTVGLPPPTTARFLLEHDGRCNHVLRAIAGDKPWIVRYHDPIGRDFLQRHDPERASVIYAAAASIISAALSSACAPPDTATRRTVTAIKTLCPAEYLSSAPGSPPNLHDPSEAVDRATIIARRIVIQEEYAGDWVKLSTMSDTPFEVAAALGESLGALHAASRNLGDSVARDDDNSSAPCAAPLVNALRRHRNLLRFRSPEDYAQWLRSDRNWLSSRIARLSLQAIGDPEPATEVWRQALEFLGAGPDEFRALFNGLADESGRSPWCLLRLDHTAANCFASHSDKGVALFDFDYVVLADPAYDLGLSLASAVLWAASSGIRTLADLDMVAAQLLAAYERSIREPTDASKSASATRQRVGDTSADIMRRGCAFAGLALARSLESDQSRPTSERKCQTPLPDVFRICNRLLASMLPSTGRDCESDDEFGGRFLAASARAVNLRIHASLRNSDATILGAEPAHCLRVWRRLVHEVTADYRTTREIIEHRLEIRDYRPRVWFDELPRDLAEDRARDIPTAIGLLRVRRFSPTARKERSGDRRRLCILLPIENGYRRTFQVLAGLAFDVSDIRDRFAIEFHVCSNFSDDSTSYEVLRFARTIAESRDIRVCLYTIDNPRKMGAPGRGRKWLKTVVVNAMLQWIQEEQSEAAGQAPGPELFLYFADDDVRLDGATSTIGEAIDILVKNPSTLLVSGTYTCDDDHGFLALSACRKRRHLFARTDAVLGNVYGGCMATTQVRLQQLVAGTEAPPLIRLPASEVDDRATSEDLLISILGYQLDLARAASRGASTDSSQRTPTPAAAYAATRLPVYHPEESSVAGYIRRLARDRHWFEAARKQFGQSAEVYRRARNESFATIDCAIAAGDVRGRLANEWLRLLRSEVDESLRSWVSMPPKIERLRSTDDSVQKTQHQVCKDIVNDNSVFAGVLDAVRAGAFGTAFVQSMEAAKEDRESAFPELSLHLGRLRRADLGDILLTNPYLYHWHAIAEESLAALVKFRSLPVGGRRSLGEQLHVDGALLNELETRFSYDARVGIANVLHIPEATITFREFLREWDPNAEAAIDDRPPHTRRIHTVIADDKSNGGASYLCGFIPLVGRGTFSQDSPRRTVYMHLLGEAVLHAVIPTYTSLDQVSGSSVEMRVPKTVYPRIEDALVTYAGPERRTPAGRFLQCLVVQRTLPPTVHRLWKSKLGDGQFVDLAHCVARFLGHLHGATTGVRGLLPPDLWPNSGSRATRRSLPAVRSLLLDHLNHVGTVTPSAYREWLRGGARRGSGTERMLADATAGAAGLASTVAGVIRQEGRSLEQLWQELCDDSVGFQTETGALGHLGIKARTLAVGLSGESHPWESTRWRGQQLYLAPSTSRLDSVYLSEHAGIWIVDPAVETGWVLDELLASRLSTAVVGRSIHDRADLRLDDSTLPELTKAFLTVYGNVLSTYGPSHPAPASANLESTSVAGHSLLHASETDAILRRSCRFAAISLLVRYHRRREYNLDVSERERLQHACIDLIHRGADLRFAFRTQQPPSSSDGARRPQRGASGR